MEKIYYISNGSIPSRKAHSLQIMQVCEGFSKKGFEVELIIPKRLNGLQESAFEYYDIDHEFTIKKLPCIDLMFLSSFLGKVANWIKIFTFVASLKIYFFFSKLGTIYTRDRSLGLFFSDFILETHDLPQTPKFFHSWLWKQPSIIVVITSFLKRKLISFGVSEDKILVEPDCVNLDKFNIKKSQEEARSILNLPSDGKIITYTGSFYDHTWKGVDVLLQSLQYLPNNIQVVLVGGDSSEVCQIRKRFKSEVESGKLILRKRTSHSNIPLYLKASDALVLPNTEGDDISESYTSPLKLFEYMASKRPIIASSLPSIEEILNEKNAVLVPAGSPQEIASAAERLLADSSLSNKLSEEAFKDVQKYTWKKRAERIYGKLLK